MHVVADLVLEVEGVTATIVGTGRDITVQCAVPARLLDALSYAALPSDVGRIDGPRALGRAARALQEAGLHVTVVGPDGPVLEIGRGTDSLLGRLITGSRAVAPGAWVAARPLASASARRSVARHPARSAGALAGLAAAAVAVTYRLRRRATGS